MAANHIRPCRNYLAFEISGKADILVLQVIRLCRQHRLTSALAYLFPRALLDYVAPVAELIVAIATAKAEEHGSEAGIVQEAQKASRSLGFKLLIYLRTNFAGLTFPPGKLRDLPTNSV